MDRPVIVIGGGLAGCEAAYQLACRGVAVHLYEMRPGVTTPAHQTDKLAEVVCSNSFKSDAPDTAAHLIKEELRALGSVLIAVAEQCRVPAGAALAVDRVLFGARVTQVVSSLESVTVIREEVPNIPPEGIVIIATGPLTSDRLSRAIAGLTGSNHLYFYDAISPIVDADSLDMSKIYSGSRYGKGSDDYLNCPMNEEDYDSFYEALINAATVPFKDFERSAFFESCLPLEELARRGKHTLAFGPLKPVGLVDPRTGRRPFAVLQLRKENLMSDSYNLVGCQNHMKFGDQQRVFRLVPGLGQAEFLRYGQVHRNTYINSPRVLLPTLQVRNDPRLFFAGQICGVEGYVECVATGLVAGINAARMAQDLEPLVFPEATACGSLCRYVALADPENFQPMNTTFGLLPTLPEHLQRQLRDKKKRRLFQVQSALESLREFQQQHGLMYRRGNEYTEKAETHK